MKNLNINSYHVYWFFIFVFAVYSGYLIRKEHIGSLIFIIPTLIVIGAFQAAWRWERKQKYRLAACYQSTKMLLVFLLLLALTEIIVKVYFVNHDNAPAIAMIGAAMFTTAADYKKYSRWAKRKPALVSV